MMAETLEIKLPKICDPTLQLPDPELLDQYRDDENRTIWLLGEIDDVVFDYVAQIIRYNRDDYGTAAESRKPIKFIIANYGGSIDNARTLAEIIRLSKTPVITIAIGMCASAATLIYLSGHIHYATTNSKFLFHKGSASNIGGNYSELASFMEDYKAEIEQLVEFYKTHTTFAPEIIEDKLAKGDWYVDVNDALSHGVVDKVVDDIEMFM